MNKNREEIKTLLANAKDTNREVLNPEEVEEILRAYQIELARSIFCKNDLEEVLQSSDEIGFPVALKLISKDILHKSDAGCVMLNLRTRDEVRQAFRNILENAQRVRLEVVIEGFLVQEMIQKGYEVIVGLATDPTFGKIILFGLGGVFVEILKDGVDDWADPECIEMLLINYGMNRGDFSIIHDKDSKRFIIIRR